MAYQLKKLPDGDLSLGNLRGELIDLLPAVSDYATGGYLIEGIGESTEGTGNVGLYKVLFVLPAGGQGGYSPVWNPATSKLQVFEPSASNSAMGEVPASTNLSAYTFQLLVAGL